MNQNRPKLIRIVGIIELLRSLSGLFIGFLGAGYLSIFVFQGAELGGRFGSSPADLILAIIPLIISIVALIGSIAVIRYKPIGRKLIIIVAISMIIIKILEIFINGPPSIVIVTIIRALGLGGMREIIGFISFFPIIYYGAIIGYFMTDEVKNAFHANKLE